MHSIINKAIIISLVLVFMVFPCTSTDIDIYYPNDNTTTDIHYAESDNYTFVSTNNISGNFSAVILNDEIVCDDILSEPHKIISPLFSIILIIILLTLIIIVVIIIKKVWRKL